MRTQEGNGLHLSVVLGKLQSYVAILKNFYGFIEAGPQRKTVDFPPSSYVAHSTCRRALLEIL